MGRRPRTKSFFEKLYYVIFAASREGRPAEIAMWSNALASLAIGGVAYWGVHSPFVLVLPIVVFILLRGAVAHRSTVCIAASMGTLAVAALGGGAFWLFAHVIEQPWAPSVAAVVGAIASATIPAWAYAKLAEYREHGPDSLVEPVSISSSNE